MSPIPRVKTRAWEGYTGNQEHHQVPRQYPRWRRHISSEKPDREPTGSNMAHGRGQNRVPDRAHGRGLNRVHGRERNRGLDREQNRVPDRAHDRVQAILSH